jgi:hypothetical protein
LQGVKIPKTGTEKDGFAFGRINEIGGIFASAFLRFPADGFGRLFEYQFAARTSVDRKSDAALLARSACARRTIDHDPKLKQKPRSVTSTWLALLGGGTFGFHGTRGA